MEDASEKKRTKYEHLVIDCHMQGWKVKCMPIEVGCKGRQLLHRALGVMGITGGVRSRAIKDITEAAEKALRWLWRESPWGQALEHTPQSDQPWLGCLVRGDIMLQDPKPIRTPGTLQMMCSGASEHQMYYGTRWQPS